MNIQLLKHSEDSTRLILIFAGWGSDAELYLPVADLGRDGWDVMVVANFREGDFRDASQLRDAITRNTSIYLFAWSLGVSAAARILRDIPLQAAFAINGTVNPVSDTEGIPPAIFHGTADNLNLRNLMKFRRRMASSAQHFAEFSHRLPAEPDIDVLREELRLFATLPQVEDGGISWTRAYIFSGDAIFPAESQGRSWRKILADSDIVVGEGAHYVALSDIVGSVIPDISKVAGNFAQALPHYDGSASPQRMIAERLGAMVRGANLPADATILEIGPGTGLFTYEYASGIEIGHATFVELYPLPPFGIAEREEYHCCDAERWVADAAALLDENHDADHDEKQDNKQDVDHDEEHDEKEIRYDAIVSASVIQWFADPKRFLENARRLLKPGGVLICSSFLPGTLGELDGVRPSPLLYRDLDTLRGWMQEIYPHSEICDETIAIHFASAREALLHLRHTGVSGISSIDPSTGAAPTTRALLAALTPRATLTYRPVYLIGRV